MTSQIDSSLVERYLKLFEGNELGFGQYPFQQQGKPPKTVEGKATLEHAQSHLEGKMGLGMVPISASGVTSWGVLDIDNHKAKVELDLEALEARIYEAGFPLFCCRSRSGGIHLFLFLTQSISAPSIRSFLKTFAKMLNLEVYEDYEIFPKQNKLEGADSIGNWINLPYYEADNTNRYCVRNGKHLGLEEFLTAVETEAISPEVLVESLGRMCDGAPPCIEAIRRGEAKQTCRNLALFNMAIFFKKASIGNWRDEVMAFNAKSIVPPLDTREVKQIISSVSKREYFYRCREEPCSSHCDKKICRTREYGLTYEQQIANGCGEMIPFTKLIKYTTNPVTWVLECGEVGHVSMTTEELMSASSVRNRIVECFSKIIPAMKNNEWTVILSGLMENVVVEEAPDDISGSGPILSALRDYTAIAREDDEDDKDHTTKLMAGIPTRRFGYIYFKADKYFEWLRRTKRTEIKTLREVCVHLRDLGIKDVAIKTPIERKSIRCWRVPAKLFGEEHVHEQELEINVEGEF